MACKMCKDKIDVQNLSVPHVIRKCSQCNREMRLREPGKDGHGIKIEKGDQFVLGKLELSVNPLKSAGFFTRYGLDWLATTLFVQNLPSNRDEIEGILEKNDQICRDLLKKSPLLAGLDFEQPSHFERVFQILEKNRITVEWWAFLAGTYSAIVIDAIQENDIKKAVWATACAERCRSMVVYKEHYEEVVWMGQSAKRIVNVIRTWHNNKENSKEEFWQKIFNENPYVLSQLFSVPVIFIKDKAYVGGMNVNRQDAKLVDYLYANESSNDSILVEIKTPTTKLLGGRYRRGVFKPSSDLMGAVSQVLDYRKGLSGNIKQLTEGTLHKIDVFNPKCIIIAGNAEKELDTDLKRKSFELYRTNSRDVEVVTYDELFRKAETLASLFNLVREVKK